MGRLSGKVAIITGATGGMGMAEVRLFAKEGAKVVATALRVEVLAQIVKEINAEYGDTVIGLKHNVANEDEWKYVVSETVKHFGKLDVLVNNAGISGNMTDTAETTTLEEWDKVLDINLKGTFLGIKHVIPEMKKAGGGSIVNISSVGGLVGASGPTAYSATKGGVRILSKNVAMDYAKEQIRVNSLHPGFIDTAMIQSVTSNKEVLNASLAVIPLNHIGQPIDIAYGALYLASDESRYVTGTELIIDGGYTAK
ncbi:SDR family NAD(P)-dependent oxidoreductase [Noviherbaspirillum sedimenti]|uniref:Glucose 1-dehydrogenase n=1 Tax=Noviherbaspirillum sedimenti TaxID=2320865 RepID=A0A3A3G8T8_9BURK|nr:glucose 1-dehydrogenase [Noviherbaspirillum sedimenti]RJG03169.1 glucose 1-dehydrogenase [Noviherbaspirillum sedimenti]